MLDKKNNIKNIFINFFYILKLFYSLIIKYLTPLLILLSPRLLSWLTHFNTPLRRLPKFKDKIEKKTNPLDEFIFYSEKLETFQEVNIVLRGNVKKIKNINIPTFFININYPQKHVPIRYYASSDRLKYKAMMGFPEREEDKKLIYDDDKKKFYYFVPISDKILDLGFYDDNLNKENYLKKFRELRDYFNFGEKYNICACFHRMNGNNIQVGSGILAIISLLKISKKVNIYGWDSFLENDLSPNFFSQTLRLWSKFRDHQPVSRFAANVINWIYAHRLINYFPEDRLSVDGKMQYVSKLKWVEKYLYKMVYK